MIPVVRCLPSVELTGLAPAGIRILAAIDRMTTILGHDLTVTSGLDSHTSGQHPKGQALDVRTKDLTEGVILALYHGMKKALGPDFTVLYEVKTKPLGVLGQIATVNMNASAPHIHAQLRKDFGPYPPVVMTTGLTA